MMLVDHAAEAEKYLEKGLELVRNGDIDNAVEILVKAAVAFERSQDFRQIPALWEAIGNLLEPSFKEEKIKGLNQLQEGTIHSVYDDKWYQGPLDYRTIPWNNWKEQTDLVHRQAWAYQWAAQHRERVGDSEIAYRFFLRAAKKAEQTKNREKDPDWPARLYRDAVLNYIRAFSTVNDKEVEKAIRSMNDLYLDVEESARTHKSLAIAYRSLAIAYRLLKSNLSEAGNLTEAERFKRKERSALTRYYFHNRSYFRAVAEWLSGSGFIYFIIGLFLMILFVFPYIYYQWGLVAPVQGKITYYDTIFYSIESALSIGHDKIFYARGYGRLLNIIEAALSWLGLGVFIWWLTRRLE